MNLIDISTPVDFNKIPKEQWIQRYYNDMAQLYKKKDFSENPLIYEYCNLGSDGAPKDLLYGITKIFPGVIDKEYFMTKGHFHQVPVAEVYYCLSGNGIILQENHSHKYILTKISEGTLVYCEVNYGHRAINIDKIEPLVLLCVARADAGHNYSFEFTHRMLG